MLNRRTLLRSTLVGAAVATVQHGMPESNARADDGATRSQLRTALVLHAANSTKLFRDATENGVIPEFDVRYSLPTKSYYITHDSVAGLTPAALDKLPTLESYLSLLKETPQSRIQLDFKDANNYDDLLKQIDQKGVLDRVSFWVIRKRDIERILTARKKLGCQKPKLLYWMPYDHSTKPDTRIGVLKTILNDRELLKNLTGIGTYYAGDPNVLWKMFADARAHKLKTVLFDSALDMKRPGHFPTDEALSRHLDKFIDYYQVDDFRHALKLRYFANR